MHWSTAWSFWCVFLVLVSVEGVHGNYGAGGPLDGDCAAYPAPAAEVTMATSPEEERDALLFLRRLAGGGWAEDVKGWDDATPMCQWSGVGCFWNVKANSLSVYWLALSNATIPSLAKGFGLDKGFADQGNILAPLQNLVCMDLSGRANTLAGGLPRRFFGDFPLLMEFRANNVDMNNALPEDTFDAPSLQVLIAVSAGIVGPLPPIGNPRYLRDVVLNYNPGLRSEFPKDMSALQSLEVLIILSCSLGGSIPSSLLDLPNLRLLKLQGNMLSGAIPLPADPRLSKLEALTLAGNYLSGEVPAGVLQIPTLEVLDLGMNSRLRWHLSSSSLVSHQRLVWIALNCRQFSGDVDDILENVFVGAQKTVTTLVLAGNLTIPQDGKDVLAGVCKMTALQKLRVQANGVTEEEAEGPSVHSCVLQHPKLTELELSGLGIQSMNSMVAESPIGSLKKLNLRFNSFQGVPPNLCRLHPSLTHLNMDHNRIAGNLEDVMELLHPCNQLVVLHMKNNQIGGSCGESGFLFLPWSLVILDLSENRLTGNVVGKLGWTDLSMIDFSFNSLTGGITPYLLDTIPNINMRGNPELRNSIELGSFHAGFAYDQSTYESVDTLHLECAAIQSAREGFVLGLDPSFSNYESCECANGFYNTQGATGSRMDASLTCVECEYGWKLLLRFDFDGWFQLATAFKAGGCDSLRSWIYFVACAAAVLCLVICLMIASICGLFRYWCMWRKSRRTIYALASKKKKGGNNLTESMREYILDPKRVVLHEKVGFGASAVVYAAKWDGRRVAVKELLDANSDWNQFESEAKVLAGLHHPNIIRLWGICLMDNPFLVLEYGSGGSLADALIHKPNTVNKLTIALDVARAVHHLHTRSPPILHRDLKPDNVILCGNIAKLTDFGISRQTQMTAAGQNMLTGMLGTCRFMAPEVISQSEGLAEYNRKCDVYSYGMLVYCLLAGTNNPFEELRWDSQVFAAIEKGERPPFPIFLRRSGSHGSYELARVEAQESQEVTGLLSDEIGTPMEEQVLWRLVTDCWAQHPADRPYFDEIVPMLEDAIRSLG